MKSILFTCIFALIYLFSPAQSKFGIRLSLSYCHAETEDQFFVNPKNQIEYKFSFIKQKQSKGLGLYFQKKTGFIFFQTELLYRTNRIEYELIEYFSDVKTPHQMDEISHYFHIPFTTEVGLWKNIRIGAGPVFNYFLHADSMINDMHNLSTKQANVSFGCQSAIGFDYKFFSIDLKYEISFTKLGENIYYSNGKHSFSTSPNQLIFSLGIAF